MFMFFKPRQKHKDNLAETRQFNKDGRKQKIVYICFAAKELKKNTKFKA